MSLVPPLRLTSSLDLVGDKIYQAVTITYRAESDPDNEEIMIPAFGTFHLAMSGEDVGKVKKFDVYLDPSPVMAAFARAEATKS